MNFYTPVFKVPEIDLQFVIPDHDLEFDTLEAAEAMGEELCKSSPSVLYVRACLFSALTVNGIGKLGFERGDLTVLMVEDDAPRWN